MKKGLLTIFLSFILLTTGCNQAPKDENAAIETIDKNAVIMKIDGTKINKDQFDNSFNKLYITSPFGVTRVSLEQKRNHKLKLLFTAKAVNDIIIRHFINEEAKKNNITVSKDEVDDIFNQVVKSMGNKDRLLSQLQVASMTEEDFRKSLEADIKAKKVIDILAENISVTDQDIKEYYEDHKMDKFNVPESARASHIFIKADPRIIRSNLRKANPALTGEELANQTAQEMENRKNKALDVLKKVTPENFSTIAEEYSDDKISATNNGDLGYFPKGKMLSGFDEAIFSSGKVQVGKVFPELVQTPIGFHIIKLTDYRKKGILSFDSVKDDIKRILTENKKVEALTEFVQKQKANADIKYIYKQFDPTVINDNLSKDPQSPASQIKQTPANETVNSSS
jgi:parvulin-like peptidyl-prolyl isomerase